MTDNQLLFYAAKAAGIDYSLRGQVPTRFDGKDFIVWNPLEHDGDALRLAVRLGITPHIDGNLTDAESTEGFCTEPHFGDPYAATRRCIVRAAAEIGKGL